MFLTCQVTVPSVCPLRLHSLPFCVPYDLNTELPGIPGGCFLAGSISQRLEGWRQERVSPSRDLSGLGSVSRRACVPSCFCLCLVAMAPALTARKPHSLFPLLPVRAEMCPSSPPPNSHEVQVPWHGNRLGEKLFKEVLGENEIIRLDPDPG